MFSTDNKYQDWSSPVSKTANVIWLFWIGWGLVTLISVFSVDLVFKEELNLMLVEASQGVVGLS